MHTIDWAIVVSLLVALTIGAISTQKHTKSVSAFMAGERYGGRYMISVAMGMAQLGVISLVWLFQQNYDIGFTGLWWGIMQEPLFIILGLTGWVIYRFRQTQALTLAQFFEMRYSRNFRVFSGLVAFLAGILNFGIFPAVGAQFFINLCGFPPSFVMFGIQVSTFVVIITVLLSIALLFTFIGGQLAIMVTDFLQGTFCNLVFLVIIIYLLYKFNWHHISETLLAAPVGKSNVNPWDLGKEDNFNFFYYLISLATIIYGCMGWQGTAGYNCAAKSAHETKMAGIISQWRWRVLMLIAIVIPICVKTFMNHQDYSKQSQVSKTILQHVKDIELDRRIKITQAELKNAKTTKTREEKQEVICEFNTLRTLTPTQIKKLKEETTKQNKELEKLKKLNATINNSKIKSAKQKEELEKNKSKIASITPTLDKNKSLCDKYSKVEQKESQARTPIVLGKILPPVLLGLFCAALLAAFISTHDTYLHSWGTMFVQDVILPFRKKELSAKAHLWWLRIGIFVVAIFIFIFSYYFTHAERIAMYCARTAAVFIGGGGAVIIGGLYWKRATTEGAWSSMITGMFLSITGIITSQLSTETIANCTKPLQFFLTLIKSMNGQEYTFLIYVICITIFVVVSLITSKGNFDLNTMLHRKKEEKPKDENKPKIAKTLLQKLGFDSNFTRGDYIIAGITFSWPIIWFSIFIVINSIHLLKIHNTGHGLTDTFWASYWHGYLYIILFLSACVTVWLTIGGFKDLQYLFAKLKTHKISHKDDGRVINHHNLSDEEE